MCCFNIPEVVLGRLEVRTSRQTLIRIVQQFRELLRIVNSFVSRRRDASRVMWRCVHNSFRLESLGVGTAAGR
jgi:hypothetical protein